MKAWRFHEFGPIENLKLETDVPDPVPADGEALVRVEYAALNPADRYLIAKQYPRPGELPLIVGRDGCGVVEQPGGSGRFKAGDHVVILRSAVGHQRDGTLAERVAVPEESLAPAPGGWTGPEAAAGPLVHLTAWQALVTEGGLQAGHNVLVTGASGGVGTAAVVLAKSLGAANVVALSRSPVKRMRLEEIGADFAFDSEDPALIDKAKDALGGGRFDVVVENLAGPFLQKSIHMAGTKARICVVGLLAGLKSEIVVGTLIHKQVQIKGIAVGNFTPDQSQEYWKRIVEILNAAGRRPLVDQVFEFGQVQEAFALLKGGVMGKVVVGPMG